MKVRVAVFLCLLWAGQALAIPAPCESSGSSGVCSQVQTVFCLQSSCSSCCTNPNSCAPSPAYVLPSQCKAATTPSPTVPVATTPSNPCSNPSACASGSTCSSVGGYAVCTPAKPTTPSAPVCGPVCGIYCLYGNVLDDRGCPTCKCNSAPVATTTSTTQAIVTTSASPTTAVTTPFKCPPLCRKFCRYGYVRDANGCQLCACLPPPSTAPPAVTTTYMCPAIFCINTCQRGYLYDRNGCKTCKCNAPPTTAPTPVMTTFMCPQVKCVPCASGYVYDANGCQTCQCSRPSVSPTRPTASPTPGPCAAVRCAGGLCKNVGGYAVCFPTCTVVTSCLRDPCGGQSCSAVPGSVCYADTCGKCSANFFLRGANITRQCHGMTTRPTARPTAASAGTMLPGTTAPPGSKVCPRFFKAQPVCYAKCSVDSDTACNRTTLCCQQGCSTTCTSPCTVPVCPGFNGICKAGGRAVSSTTGCPLCRCTSRCELQRRNTTSRQPVRGRRQIGGSVGGVGGYVVACDDDGSFKALQCHGSTGYCWCVDATTGVNTTQHVGPALVRTLPCFPSATTTSKPTTTRTQCPVCAKACQYGRYYKKMSTGCTLCFCKAAPESMHKTFTVVLSVSANLLNAIKSKYDTFGLDVRAQISKKLNIPIEQLQNFVTTTKETSTGYAARVTFDVYGSAASPDPATTIDTISEAVESGSLTIAYTDAASASYSVQATDSYTGAPPDTDDDDDDNTVKIAVGVAVPVALIAIIVVVALYVTKQNRSTVAKPQRLTDDPVAVKFDHQAGHVQGMVNNTNET